MRAWIQSGYGEPRDVLTLQQWPAPSPGNGELLVDVEAAGINFPDLLMVRGEYQNLPPLPAVQGSELVGRVVAQGPDTTLPNGTRIWGSPRPPHGSMAEQSVVQETNVIAVPEDLAANHILALGNYVTSYFALHTRARLQPGETVLVHGAAGGIGSSATQLALVAGCRVLATERGADRVKLCRGLGADLVVDTDDDDFVAAVNEATLGHGVDLVIDPVGGDIFDLSRRCIAFGGRIVVVGFTSGRIPELRVNHLILRNFGVMGVNAAAYVFDPRHRHFYDQARNELLQMCRQGDVSPVIHGESPLEMLVDVLADLDRGAVLGKAVIRPSSTATTPRSGQ